jgi:hypothetical protein
MRRTCFKFREVLQTVCMVRETHADEHRCSVSTVFLIYFGTYDARFRCVFPVGQGAITVLHALPKVPLLANHLGETSARVPHYPCPIGPARAFWRGGNNGVDCNSVERATS